MDDFVLSEEDVPGAFFRKDSAIQLKRWLECHGLKQTGKAE